MKLQEGDIQSKVSLMNIYYMPGTVLATKDKTVNKIVTGPALMDLISNRKGNY